MLAGQLSVWVSWPCALPFQSTKLWATVLKTPTHVKAFSQSMAELSCTMFTRPSNFQALFIVCVLVMMTFAAKASITLSMERFASWTTAQKRQGPKILPPMTLKFTWRSSGKEVGDADLPKTLSLSFPWVPSWVLHGGSCHGNVSFKAVGLERNTLWKIIISRRKNSHKT